MTDKVFATFRLEHDRFNTAPAVLLLDDLPPRWNGTPRLTVMMSVNDYRAAQLARSLEALARQAMREFEVLVCDNGSSIPLSPIVERLQPYLNVQCTRLERTTFYVCPTKGLKALLPHARGEVIAIMQPEMLLLPKATDYLLKPHFEDAPDVFRYKISASRISMRGRPTWVNLKPATLSPKITMQLDKIDWHTDMAAAIEGQEKFDFHEANFAQLSNEEIQARVEFPYWFAGSALASDPLWKAMPSFLGHASIDFWLLNYRREAEYVDLVPRQRQGYHQSHVYTALAPESEARDSLVAGLAIEGPPMGIKELRQWVASYGAPTDGNYETLWERLLKTRIGVWESGRRGGIYPGPGGAIGQRPASELSVRIRRIRGLM